MLTNQARCSKISISLCDSCICQSKGFFASSKQTLLKVLSNHLDRDMYLLLHSNCSKLHSYIAAELFIKMSSLDANGKPFYFCVVTAVAWLSDNLPSPKNAHTNKPKQKKQTQTRTPTRMHAHTLLLSLTDRWFE